MTGLPPAQSSPDAAFCRWCKELRVKVGVGLFCKKCDGPALMHAELKRGA